PHLSDGIEIPVFDYWIFEITVGVDAHAGVTAMGTLSPVGFNLGFTPEVGVGASINGEINIGIASGGVSADIDLASFSTPLTAGVTWTVSTEPGVCSGTLNFATNADLIASALGGRVELWAKFGICPFCDHESQTIFDWDPLAQHKEHIFDFATKDQLVSLPS